MKKLFCSFLLLTVMHSFSVAQAPADLITTLRMGPFKLNATPAEVEKVIGKKIELHHKEYVDTVDVNYSGIAFTLVFSQEYNEDAKKPALWKLYAVSSAATPLKTKSLIGIGSTKTAILQAYDKYDVTIYNDYEYKEKGNAKDKIQFIHLMDSDAGTEILFTTENRVVKKIEVAIIQGD